MDDVFEMSMLLDFYGQLLTQRQYELMDLYYNNDYSLAEISEQLDISRQGVHDGIKKSKTILIKMEQKLGLVSRFDRQKSKAKEAYEIIKSMQKESFNNEFIKFSELKENLLKLESCIETIINQEEDKYEV